MPSQYSAPFHHMAALHCGTLGPAFAVQPTCMFIFLGIKLVSLVKNSEEEKKVPLVCFKALIAKSDTVQNYRNIFFCNKFDCDCTSSDPLQRTACNFSQGQVMGKIQQQTIN